TRACRSSKVHTGQGCRWEISEVDATTTALGRAPASIWKSAHHNVSEKGDRVARLETACDRHLRCRCPSVPVMQTTDSILCPRGERHRAAVQSAERPASPS